MDDLFYSKIDDLRRAAAHGDVACGPFLSENDRARAQAYLDSAGADDCLFWGGYPAAERTRLCAFPYWTQPSPEALGEFVVPLLIRGSGYAELDHRAYLGSLTAAGLSRDVIGDIVVQDASSAVVFFEGRIAGYLLSSPDAPDRVGRDKVTFSRYTLPYGFTRAQDYVGVNATVASARADCVIAALISASREKAKELIRQGMVQVDHAPCASPDVRIEDGAVISIRGHGKFRVDSIGSKTKKDRLRMLALKYV